MIRLNNVPLKKFIRYENKENLMKLKGGGIPQLFLKNINFTMFPRDLNQFMWQMNCHAIATECLDNCSKYPLNSGSVLAVTAPPLV